MKFLLALILFCSVARAADVALAWDNRATNAIAVRVYFGTNDPPAQFVSLSPTNTTATISNAAPGRTYYRATEVAADGNESAPSNLAVYTNLDFGPTNFRLMLNLNLEGSADPRSGFTNVWAASVPHLAEASQGFYRVRAQLKQ